MSEEKKNYVFIGGRMQGKTRDLINQLIEENKHLQQKVEQLEKENKELKQPQVFIDCENMEERYGRDLYEDYLKEKIEQLENIIKEAIKLIEEDILGEKIENVNWDYDECYYSDMPAERVKPLLNILNKGNDK